MQTWHVLFEGKETIIRTDSFSSQGIHKQTPLKLLVCSSHVNIWNPEAYLGRKKLKIGITKPWTLVAQQAREVKWPGKSSCPIHSHSQGFLLPLKKAQSALTSTHCSIFFIWTIFTFCILSDTTHHFYDFVIDHKCQRKKRILLCKAPQ
jgi:hypothetical protein